MFKLWDTEQSHVHISAWTPKQRSPYSAAVHPSFGTSTRPGTAAHGHGCPALQVPAPRSATKPFPVKVAAESRYAFGHMLPSTALLHATASLSSLNSQPPCTGFQDTKEKFWKIFFKQHNSLRYSSMWGNKAILTCKQDPSRTLGFVNTEQKRE